jgi:LmbE family N-acetylglucosaminyl deacetylase
MRTASPHHLVAELGRIVTVWAHPDDESYLVAGVMASATDLGAPVTCVTATAGERGGPADLEAELAWRRPEELEQALAVLGVDDHVLLGHRDGGCQQVDRLSAATQLALILRDRRPDTVITFGPDGLTGHPDHQAVSGWVDLAVALFDGPTPTVLHATETSEHLDALAGHPDAAALATSTHEREDLALQLVLDDDQLDRKVRALRAHRTQTAPLETRLGPDRYREWVRRESFVVAPISARARALAGVRA